MLDINNVCSIEPRLRLLLNKATSYKEENNSSLNYCANHFYYTDIVNEVNHLKNKDILVSTEYEYQVEYVFYEFLRKAKESLGPCRDCTCFEHDDKKYYSKQQLVWFCDACGGLIESPEDGCIEWGETVEFKMVHNPGSSPRRRRGCSNENTDNRKGIEYFSGSDGLKLLIDIDWDEEYLQDIIKRIHVPGYEFVRRVTQNFYTEKSILQDKKFDCISYEEVRSELNRLCRASGHNR